MYVLSMQHISGNKQRKNLSLNYSTRYIGLCNLASTKYIMEMKNDDEHYNKVSGQYNYIPNSFQSKYDKEEP
jgi:hypothetical protein